ncbi:GRAM domain-containing protein 2B-like isoform X2 [Centruroides sculpturatus]|uniref:GRAM domain-containing protein 2B-like isoform X2 n=2 Tax=Centruroides sculpturatus TaxID=218467 RepID=UPI000C6EFE05|nr:GRAM domain-containing protein 2B-like isoform X2 [Centruroides sculpturatus]
MNRNWRTIWDGSGVEEDSRRRSGPGESSIRIKGVRVIFRKTNPEKATIRLSFVFAAKSEAITFAGIVGTAAVGGGRPEAVTIDPTRRESCSSGGGRPVGSRSLAGLETVFSSVAPPTEDGLEMPSPSPTVPPPSPAPSTQSRLRKSHGQRFHRRFPQVDPEEPLLDYYSCALLADILLQGQLYVTENHFAFYSNIFGHKTQILIPVREVVEVSKECTARIIPNAVGISTEEEKYVFGSLLSRTSTFQLMRSIWLSSADAELSAVEDSESGNTSSMLPNVTEDEDSVASENHLRRMSTVSGIACRRISEVSLPTVRPNTDSEIRPLRCRRSGSRGYLGKAEEMVSGLYRLPGTTLLLLLTTVLLALLLLSATVLLYRIAAVHRRVAMMEDRQRRRLRNAEGPDSTAGIRIPKTPFGTDERSERKKPLPPSWPDPPAPPSPPLFSPDPESGGEEAGRTSAGSERPTRCRS